MALINCPECGKQISNNAENCPNCGYPINKKNYSKQKNKIVVKSGEGCFLQTLNIGCIIIAIIIIIIILIILFSVFFVL